MKKLLRKIKGYGFYYKDRKELKRQKGDDQSFVFGKRYPILNERFQSAGTMNGHYFHQDLYVARQIFNHKPVHHVDIGSRADGFVAHVAVFRKIEILDIRTQNEHVENISFRQADLMQLPDDMIDYCDSLSTLHAVEHFGLGRYGDPVDYYGHVKGIENMTKMLKSGGRFYFSVPIGKQRIEFNAHRVFSIDYLLDLFNKSYSLDKFSYVDDKGKFHENIKLSDESIKANFNCRYGCGIFELIKN